MTGKTEEKKETEERGVSEMKSSRDILEAYVDACALVKETEEDIRRLSKRETVHDRVKGSNPDFPYQPRNFRLYGTAASLVEYGASPEREKELLRQRRENAERIKSQAEKVMAGASVRVQRIIRYKVFKGLTWEEVAVKMGGKATAESVRKEYERFLE